MASLSRTVIAPAACSCSAVTGWPSQSYATVIAPEPPTQVVEVARDGGDRHHLGGGRDVEAGLAHVAVRAAAEADHDLAERAVVHVHAATPADA